MGNYVSCPAADAEVAIRQLGACVADVDARMKANWLRLNPQKTQLIWLGSPQQLERLTMVDIEMMSASLSPLSTVRDLGVNTDSLLTMADHVSAVCRACYFQMRQLRVVLQSRQRRPRHWSTPSSAAALTTVMPCYIALQIVSFSDCSLCRTLLRGWSLACGERSTSRRS